MPTNLGVIFGCEVLGEGGVESWRNKISGNKIAEKFAGKFMKFAGPNQKTIHPKTALQNLEINLFSRNDK